MTYLSALFKSKPLIDEQSAQWIHDVFDWARANFDGREFVTQTRLVLPTNEFFSGKVSSQHEMAENIFKHTLSYCGLTNWPFELQQPQEFLGLPPPHLGLSEEAAFSRDSSGSRDLLALASNDQKLYLSYRPEQTAKPADLASTFAHLMAQHCVMQTQRLPPGDEELILASTEVLAIFMGFGVLFANSAYTYKGGCGSCYCPTANRQSSLSEDEAIYALALFCHLKAIGFKQAVAHLKPHLKPAYKRAKKQIEARA